MRAGQRGVSAERNFRGGGEKSNGEPRPPRQDECRLGQVHFGGYVLHPLGSHSLIHQHHAGGIAFERLGRKGIYLVNCILMHL